MRETLVYRFGVLTASGIALNLLGFCYRTFLARTVGADGMGVYHLVLPFYSLLQSATLTGLCTAVNTLSARESLYGAKAVFKRSARVFLALFALVFTLCITCTDFFAGTVLGDMRTKPALMLTLPCLLLTGFENLLKNYFYGTRFPRAPITSELTEQAVRFGAVFALFFAFRPTDPTTACALILLGMVASEVVSVLLLSRVYRAQRAPITRVLTTRRDVVKTALPIMASGTLLNLLGAVGAVLIPRGLVAFGFSPNAASAEYGELFGMTLPLLSLPLALLGALPAVLIPSLSNSYSQKNVSKARRLAGKAFHITGLLAFPLTALTLLYSDVAMEWFYQQKTAEGVLLPLCLATFFSFYQLTGCAVLNGVGKTRHVALFALISGLVQLVCTLLVGRFGISAFLWGDLFSTALCALLCFVSARHVLRFSVRYQNWVLRPCLATALAAALARPISPCLLAVCVFFAAYFLSLRAMGTSLYSYLKPLLKPRFPSQTQRSHPVQG